MTALTAGNLGGVRERAHPDSGASSSGGPWRVGVVLRLEAVPLVDSDDGLVGSTGLKCECTVEGSEKQASSSPLQRRGACSHSTVRRPDVGDTTWERLASTVVPCAQGKPGSPTILRTPWAPPEPVFGRFPFKKF
jgi:hypothetical protein